MTITRDFIRIYLSARYDRREEIDEYAETLLHEGFVIVSSWHEDQRAVEEARLHPHVKHKMATQMLYELCAADMLVAFSEEPDSPYGRGGRHVEFGLALMDQVPILVVGPQENIFHHLHYIVNVDDFPAALKLIGSLEAKRGKDDGLIPNGNTGNGVYVPAYARAFVGHLNNRLLLRPQGVPMRRRSHAATEMKEKES